MSLLGDRFPALKQRALESRRAKSFQGAHDLGEEAQKTIIRVKVGLFW
jgi:hypothetical protein